MRGIIFAAVLLLAAGRAAPAQELKISSAQAAELGDRIWKNECGSKDACLLWWNKGEEFASLGLGHFIWYPRGYRGPFTESFPQLALFLEKNGVRVPAWVRDAACPWKTREEFFAEPEEPRKAELRRLLLGTFALQARFEAQRLEQALPKMLESLPSGRREGVRGQFYRVAAATGGLYALMDYVNFKGEGVSPTERYRDQGWGLLQALEGMSGPPGGRAPLEEFVRSAYAVLERRVKNSPPERNEARWLPIWQRRLQTYLR